ncbi:MAG: hypothetical protein Q8R13_04160 [bacterium]|nr:hypothetical protein [bacterium]
MNIPETSKELFGFFVKERNKGIMETKFIELLPKTGDVWTSLFDVDGVKVKIGISGAMCQVLDIQEVSRVIALLLQQIGALKIQLMPAEGNL